MLLASCHQPRKKRLGQTISLHHFDGDLLAFIGRDAEPPQGAGIIEYPTGKEGFTTGIDHTGGYTEFITIPVEHSLTKPNTFDWLAAKQSSNNAPQFKIMASVDDDPYLGRGVFEQGFDTNGTWFKLYDTDGVLIYTSPTYVIGWGFWVHYACSFNGNNFKYWINGILTYDIDIAEVINTSVEKLCFGSLHMAFDEIRVSNIYRYTDDFAIPAKPYTGFEPPLSPDPTLGLWHFDNSVVGEVGLPWTTSTQGIISTKEHTGFDVGVLMDTFCYINYAIDNFDSTGYTIEMFGSPTVDNGAPIRARTGTNGSGGEFTILSQYNKLTGFVSVTWRDTEGATIASGSGTVDVLEWCHLAIQFNDTVIEFYCNGVLLSSTDHTVGGKTPRGIGSITQDSVENCYLDEYRISRGFVYSGATYTIPTEPFTLPPSDYDY